MSDMPVSGTTFARLAATLGGFDAGNAEAVGSFYVDVFPTYAESARTTIGDWLASLTTDASEDDLERLVETLRALGDDRARSLANRLDDDARSAHFGGAAFDGPRPAAAR